MTCPGLSAVADTARSLGLTVLIGCSDQVCVVYDGDRVFGALDIEGKTPEYAIRKGDPPNVQIVTWRSATVPEILVALREWAAAS